MLLELRIENLLLIQKAELRLSSGFNVVTGETGAGKTVLAHALDLLLGVKPKSGLVRPGAKEAWVEGVFEIPANLPAEIADRIPTEDDTLVLARRISAEGRSSAYICGRSASASDLQQLGPLLVAFHGQAAARDLLSPSAQTALLDRYCGEDHLQRVAAHGVALQLQNQAQAELDQIKSEVDGREREIDILQFELAEIEQVNPVAGEIEELEERRKLVAGASELRQVCQQAADDLDAEGSGAVVALESAARLTQGSSESDKQLTELSARIQSLAIEASDVAADLRNKLRALDFEPGELEQIDDRLSVLLRLQRKYGGSLDEAIAHGESCRRRLEILQDIDCAAEQAQSELDRRTKERKAIAKQLTVERKRVAVELAGQAMSQLEGLAMQGATLQINVNERDVNPSGSDQVEILLAPNKGVKLSPLRESASGGELSRTTLALLSVLKQRSLVLQVFDEIDSGVGGATGRAVGQKLFELAQTGQILCITHLPQVAALAETHFSIEKDPATDPATTTVTQLEGSQTTAELVRMLGGGEGDEGAFLAARELQNQAA